MATQEQISLVVQALEQVRPEPLLSGIHATHAGMGAVMRLLSQSEGPLTPGAISARLQVSTARVAALLKKMDAKGLILRHSDAGDGRVTHVRLSTLGQSEDQKLHDDLWHNTGQAIDQLGLERLLAFAQTARQLQQIYQPPDVNL